MSSTLIQIVDEHDQPIEASTMDDAQKNGKIHRIVRVMVEDPNGNILLQRRAETMTLYPGRWDCSAAGHVDQGEDYLAAAKRELAEEVGIAGAELNELGYYRTHGSFEGRQLNRFNKAYKAVVPSETKLSLQAEEVAATKWFTPDEFKQLAGRHPDQVTDGIVEIYERFYR